MLNPFRSTLEAPTGRLGIEAFLEDAATRYSPNTLKAYATTLRSLVFDAGCELEELDRAGVLDLIGTLTRTCKNFVRPEACRKLPELQCERCPLYEQRSVTTIQTSIIVLHTYLKWVEEQGHELAPGALAPIRSWTRSHRRSIRAARERRHHKNRYLDRAELAKIIRAAPPQWALVFTLMARYGLRSEDLPRLRRDPSHLSSDALLVPAPSYPGKRARSTWFPIDSEIRVRLLEYFAWRQRAFQRAGEIDDAPELIVLKSRSAIGTARTDAVVTDALRRYAVAADVDATGLRSHSLRHFFTNTALQTGVTGEPLQLLRGGSLDTTAAGSYIDPERVAEYWRRASPTILV